MRISNYIPSGLLKGMIALQELLLTGNAMNETS
jgi:hypothetical protein